MTKKEKIYIITQFLVSFCGLTWVQIAYNDPAVLLVKNSTELLALLGISLVMVLANTGIVWLAYLSDPKEAAKEKVVKRDPLAAKAQEEEPPNP
jgi:hypothetical protein